MASSKAQMNRLLEQRARLAAEIDALRNKLEGLDMAIQLLSSDDDTTSSEAVHNDVSRPSRRANVKGITLQLLEESGSEGLSSNDVVERAQNRGHSLDRGSVSSLLSRLKKEGTLIYDGTKYYLAQNAPVRMSGPHQSDGSSPTLSILRSVKPEE
jgi:CRP-like cAMP-binding protein